MSSSSSQYATISFDAILTEAGDPILTEASESMIVDLSGSSSSSSSSSSMGNIFLDNIDLFRQYSLDAGLIDLYFNKGINPVFVDLDQVASSSSSSSSQAQVFLLRITLARSIADPFRQTYQFPEDIAFRFYDESVDGTPTPGLLSAVKNPGRNEILLSMPGGWPDPAVAVSFQLNIQHPSFSKSNTVFTCRNQTEYAHEIKISERIKNSDPNLSAPYIAYLVNWISEFWVGYDAGDKTLVSDLARPPEAVNTGFDPFAHARWKILQTVGGQSQLELKSLADLPLAYGNSFLLEGWNFLGLPRNIWNCINTPNEQGQKLYYNYDKQPIDLNELGDWVGMTPDQIANDRDFDCRSFSASAMYFLRKQLLATCPGTVQDPTEVRVRGISNGRGAHALLYVHLGGDPERDEKDCCRGTFMYEPATGAVYSSVETFCSEDQYKKLCSDSGGEGAYWYTYPVGEESDPNLFPQFDSMQNPNWEKFPSELNRIQGVICGCLTGEYRDGTTEKTIQGKCQDGTFKDWFKGNFSYEPGVTQSPSGLADIPQIISCDKVTCASPPETGQSPCVASPDGTVPYVCETACKEVWVCNKEAGLVCPPQHYADVNLGLNPNEYLKEADCTAACSCPPGYREVPLPSNMLGSQANCVPDCNFSQFLCLTGYCCEENVLDAGNSCQPCDGCCEPNPVLGSQSCVPCPTKVKSFRFNDAKDQRPESGNRPFG